MGERQIRSDYVTSHGHNIPCNWGIAEDMVQGLQIALHCLGVEEVNRHWNAGRDDR